MDAAIDDGVSLMGTVSDLTTEEKLKALGDMQTMTNRYPWPQSSGDTEEILTLSICHFVWHVLKAGKVLMTRSGLAFTVEEWIERRDRSAMARVEELEE